MTTNRIELSPEQEQNRKEAVATAIKYSYEKNLLKKDAVLRLADDALKANDNFLNAINTDPELTLKRLGRLDEAESHYWIVRPDSVERPLGSSSLFKEVDIPPIGTVLYYRDGEIEPWGEL